ncbi:glycosyltransferase [Trichothermofontia sp.]
MILVTVGNEQYPFNRLMNWLTVLREANFLAEPLLIQSGTCTQLPSDTTAIPFLTPTDLKQRAAEAQIIISHCGQASINLLQAAQRPYILVPRCQRFGERADNQQLLLAAALYQRGVPIAWSPGDLVRHLQNPCYVSLPLLTGIAAALLCNHLEEHFGANVGTKG